VPGLRRRPTWLPAAGLVAVLVVPLVVAGVALRRPTWFPVLDHAMTELRVRDVVTGHTPLIGLPGRIGDFPDQGSHPGPMSFYALWPTYRLLGGSAWGLQVGALVLNAVAVATSVALAWRRAGARLAVGITALLALLMAGYGIATLAEPWNPYLPLLWWVVVLLAVWSVLCGDVRVLPVAVVAASMAAQTHVPYLGLGLGMGAVALGGVAWRWRQEPGERPTILRWVGISLAVTVALWGIVVVDQAVNDPGNLSMLWDHFTTPPEGEETVGLVGGIELVLRHLDVTAFFSGGGDDLGSLARSSGDAGGSVLPGLLLLVAWAAAAVVAWRRRHALLNRLNVVVAAGLLLGVVSLSRIFGRVWYYLMLWSWATTGLAVLAVVWTIALVVDRRDLDRPAQWALVGVAVVAAAVLTVDADDARPPAPQLSEVLAEIVPPAAERLDPDDRYLVTWDDSFYIGSQGYGVVSELERRGFDAGALAPWRVPITPHRVYGPDEVDAELHLAVGAFVDRWRDVAAAEELAVHDPRDAAELARYQRLRDEVAGRLAARDLDELVPLVDDNLFGLSIRDELDEETRRLTEEMLELGTVGALFLVPPGTTL
jgi:hypothetical protein